MGDSLSGSGRGAMRSRTCCRRRRRSLRSRRLALVLWKPTHWARQWPSLETLGGMGVCGSDSSGILPRSPGVFELFLG